MILRKETEIAELTKRSKNTHRSEQTARRCRRETTPPRTKYIQPREELHGNYVLRPPESAGAPRALIHFLGGALLGAAPQSTYRYLLERLSSRGYLVVATPYQVRN